MTISLVETLWVPRWAMERIGIVIYSSGEPIDPDANLVDADIVRVTGGSLGTRLATRDDVGTFGIDLSTADTADPGNYQVTWLYTVAGIDQSQMTVYEVGQAAPDYVALDEPMRYVVDQVWNLFSDGFDSPYGGPNLQAYYQARGFGRNRVAQLLYRAVGRLNAVAQPHMTYSVSGDSEFPVAQWGATLEKALTIEVVRHLIRSYVEQPAVENVATARVDRRDYVDRWRVVLEDETEDFESMLDVFKIANMGLGNARALVSGGAYGNWGPTRLPMSAAARPRYWSMMVR